MKNLPMFLASILIAAMLLTGCSNGFGGKAPDSGVTDNSAPGTDSAGGDITSADTYEGYVFHVPVSKETDSGGEDISQVSLMVGLDPTAALNQIADPLSTYEAESCALPGMDVIYTFSGYELTVFQEGRGTSSDKNTSDADSSDKGGSAPASILTSIRLTDDSHTTAEGIYIGSTVKEVLDTYGGCEPVSGEYCYPKGGMELAFLTRNGVVTSIEYRMAE